MTPSDAAMTPSDAAMTPSDAAISTANRGPTKKLRLLSKRWSRKKVDEYMKTELSEALGVDCDHCHDENDYAAGHEKKNRALEMMRMTRAINRTLFRGKPKVTCYTCHRGESEPDETASSRPQEIARGGPTGPMKNLRVLPRSMTKRPLKRLMKLWSRSLGIKCEHCHDVDDMPLDTKEKRLARRMFTMTERMDRTYFKKSETHLNCETCHRGSTEPKRHKRTSRKSNGE